jgi:hypothetical protein
MTRDVKKIISKDKKEAKKKKSVNRFGGLRGKKKKKGTDVDVCIKVKGEDGSINEIVIPGG